MKLDEYVAVSGLPDVYKMINSRSNGLMLADIDSGRTKFYSVRKHQFTPMGSVAIYTLEDTIALTDVFKLMKSKEAELPVPKASSDKMVMLEYFEQIVPDYDEDRVYVSDIKKVIKWFNFLNTRKIIDQAMAEEKEGAKEETKASSEEE